MVTLEERIAMAMRCRDADVVPKVDNAGSVLVSQEGVRYQLMHNGIKIVADGYCGPWMTELIRRCQGHHEPQEERVFHTLLEHLSSDATMIELGGWWAYYSMWFVQSHPRRRAVVVEPDPQHLALGQSNANLNGVKLRFVPGFAGAVPAAALPFTIESGEEIFIPRVTVPQLMNDHGIETLDVLHADTQGAELIVLESCEALLRQGRIRLLVLSTHHWLISGNALTHQLCLDRIIDFGGHVIAEHDVHESFSGDGLIVASFGPGSADFPTISMSHNRYSTSLFRNPLFDLAEQMRR